MKLTVEEGNYIQGLVAQARNLYGKTWERILKKTALALPEKGLNTRTGVLEEFDAQKEEKVIKKLVQKNILEIRQEQTDIQRQGSFQDRYGDGNDKFIGLRPKKLEKLKDQLDL